MKRWLVLLLLLAATCMVVGCAGGDEDAGPEGQEATAETDEAAMDDLVEEEPVEPAEVDSDAAGIDDFAQLNSVTDFAVRFQEMEYSYSSLSADGVEITNRYTFSVLDEKVENGLKAHQIQFIQTGDEDETSIECWVDEDGEVLEATVDGEEVEGMALDMVGVSFYSFISPFVLSSVWEPVLTSQEARELMNWKITDEGSKSKDLGAGSVPIQFYELETENETGYFEVANIGGQSLFVNYKTTNQQGNTYELNVTRLVPK